MRKSLIAAVLIAAAYAASGARGADFHSFPEVSRGLSDAGMTSAEKAVVARCKRKAQGVYGTAVATHRSGSPQPDIVAIGYLRDCMVANAPGR